MLKRLSCNDNRFKTVTFEPGLNLIVADRTKKSSKKDTRNGLGKTTLIEILHFCFGADYEKLKTLKAPELKSWEFNLDLVINDRDITITRSLEVPTLILLSGEVTGIELGTDSTDHPGKKVMTNGQWTTLLGLWMFGLPVKETPIQVKYRPSFRSLISYFMRRSPGSYLDPFTHFAQQRDYDKQVCNTFLLGLNYDYAREFQVVKDKDADIKERKKQAEKGVLPGAHGTLGELEARKVPLQEHIKRESEQLSSFQINPHYREIEVESVQLMKKLHKLTEENIADQRLKEFYEDSLEQEFTVKGKDLLVMYDQLNVALPELVTKRFEEVQLFHEQLLSNRRKFLADEIARLDKLITGRGGEKERIASERAKLMAVLRTQGALEEYSKLQDNLNDLVATLKAIDHQIQVIKQVEKDRSNLRIEKELLFQKAQLDFDERVPVRTKAISLFNENSKALYNQPGELIIELDKKTGYKFGIEIERSPSEGVGHMKVLCYDLTVQQLWRDKESGPELLVHDSTIFDGVDERQRASAINLLKSESESRNFQYVLAMNTDMIPYDEFDVEFKVDTFVRCRLTDRGEDGGLLGFRLKSTEKATSPKDDEAELAEAEE